MPQQIHFTILKYYALIRFNLINNNAKNNWTKLFVKNLI